MNGSKFDLRLVQAFAEVIELFCRGGKDHCVRAIRNSLSNALSGSVDDHRGLKPSREIDADNHVVAEMGLDLGGGLGGQPRVTVVERGS